MATRLKYLYAGAFLLTQCSSQQQQDFLELEIG